MSKILILEPNNQFKEVEFKGNIVPYELLKESVDGLIECYDFSRELYNAGIDCFVNEEYLLLDNMKPNLLHVDREDKIKNIVLGNMVFCRYDNEGQSLPLSDSDIELIKNTLSNNIGMITYKGYPYIVTVYQD
jgi:hypothetical protein